MAPNGNPRQGAQFVRQTRASLHMGPMLILLSGAIRDVSRVR
jgi:hypothetical protein